MTDFRQLSARERVEPALTARIEQLAHPNNTFAAAARAKELLDQMEADARRPLEAQVARIRAFLEDMAGWCSPHGVAADYAKRGLDALDGVDPLDETEAEIDAAMAVGEPVELVDLPDLTAEDAVEAMQDMATDLYRAEDRLAFVREMCDLADREQRQVTTEQVRAWTQYTGCGGVLQLTDQQAETLAADLNAGRVKSRKARIIELRDTDEHPAAIAIPTAGEEL